MNIKVAISQKPPKLLDLDGTIDLCVEIIAEAAHEGAKLIVFPECFLPGYPTWIWRLRPGGDMGVGNEIHALLRENAVDVGRGGLGRIQDAAAEHDMVVVVGMNEIDNAYSGSTLFNSVAIIDANGELLNVHRKLMPTNPERMVWGAGDANGLRVVDTAVGRVGSLICWESYMPLARYALYSQDIDIYVAPTWDNGDIAAATASHIAREGGCWVLQTATALKGSDVPADLPGRENLFNDDEWINAGDALVAKPGGGIIAGPMHQQQDILYADLDPEAAKKSRKALDVAGHYGRHDLFSLEIDRTRKVPVKFKD